MNGSLTVVGTGIKSLAHMTTDAMVAIQTADKVLYGACEKLTIDWITRNAKSSEYIDVLYEEGKDRMDTYNSMAELILENVRAGHKVCLSVEGHPGIFVHVTHRCIRALRSEGYSVKMLPGISAQDCLVADILVDPAEFGCQSFEATDFLLRGYQPDTTSMLVLWQVGCIGQWHYSTHRQPEENVRVLKDVLSKYYSPVHKVFAYQAALFSISSPTIVETEIQDLDKCDLSLSTLYVPPLREGNVDIECIQRLGLEIPTSLKE